MKYFLIGIFRRLDINITRFKLNASFLVLTVLLPTSVEGSYSKTLYLSLDQSLVSKKRCEKLAKRLLPAKKPVLREPFTKVICDTPEKEGAGKADVMTLEKTSYGFTLNYYNGEKKKDTSLSFKGKAKNLRRGWRSPKSFKLLKRFIKEHRTLLGLLSKGRVPKKLQNNPKYFVGTMTKKRVFKPLPSISYLSKSLEEAYINDQTTPLVVIKAPSESEKSQNRVIARMSRHFESFGLSRVVEPENSTAPSKNYHGSLRYGIGLGNQIFDDISLLGLVGSFRYNSELTFILSLDRIPETEKAGDNSSQKQSLSLTRGTFGFIYSLDHLIRPWFGYQKAYGVSLLVGPAVGITNVSVNITLLDSTGQGQSLNLNESNIFTFGGFGLMRYIKNPWQLDLQGKINTALIKVGNSVFDTNAFHVSLDLSYENFYSYDSVSLHPLAFASYDLFNIKNSTSSLDYFVEELDLKTIFLGIGLHASW